MICPVKPLKSINNTALFLSVCLFNIGCGSPPSVMPLLEVTEQALRAESDHLTADAEHDAQAYQQRREALSSAYQRDLAEQSELSAEWVMSATQAYAIAREELLRHAMHRQSQRQQRRDNLDVAADAIQHATAILAQQDALINRAVGGRLWTLLADNE